MSTVFSIGQMNQLGDALELAGFTPDEVTKLRNSPQLKDFKRVINGHAQIVTVKHVIDCDANPYIPDGWKVENHRKHGQFEYDPEKIELYLSRGQKFGTYIEGNKLRKELESQPVLNANVLDYLLAHPELISESWKDRAIFFWGTIYCSSGGYLCVRSLCWDGRSWDWAAHWLDFDFRSRNPAAVAGK